MNTTPLENGLFRTGVTVMTALCLLTFSIRAQQAGLVDSRVAATTNQQSGSTLERPVPPEAITSPSILEPGKHVGGAIPALFRCPKPLQMINPFAPPEYGDGTQFLSTNPVTGQPEGITLISLKLPGKFFKPKKNPPTPPKLK